MMALKSALISSLLTAILAGSMYILQVGDIFKIELHSLANVVVLAILTGVVSLIKAGLTNDAGKALGVQIK